MNKKIRKINLDYTFDTTHKGANYTFDHKKWMNTGEFAEIITKAVLGYEAKKNANTRYDEASDIEEINASVKSSRFTLVNMKLAETFEETITKYFETVHSNIWIYTVVIENEATLYYMNKTEFNEFLHTFCFFNERFNVRCRATSGKMIAWLESKLE